MGYEYSYHGSCHMVCIVLCLLEPRHRQLHALTTPIGEINERADVHVLKLDDLNLDQILTMLRFVQLQTVWPI